MALVPCPHCRHLVSDKALVCPTCGAELSQNPSQPAADSPAGEPRKRRGKGWLIAVLILLLLVGAGVAYYLLVGRDAMKERAIAAAKDSMDLAIRHRADSLVASVAPGATILDAAANGDIVYTAETTEDSLFNASHPGEKKVCSLFLLQKDNEYPVLLVKSDPKTGLSTFSVDQGAGGKVPLVITNAKLVCHNTRVCFSCPMGDESAIVICEVSDHLVRTLAVGKSFRLVDDNVEVADCLYEGVRQTMLFDPITCWPLQ